MAAKKTPLRVDDVVRPKFGLANVLAQSETVANAFGRWPGFVIMMTALLVSGGFVAALAIGSARIVSHFFQ
jgi:hypothetical protein